MGSRLSPSLPAVSPQPSPPDRLGCHQKSAIAHLIMAWLQPHSTRERPEIHLDGLPPSRTNTILPFNYWLRAYSVLLQSSGDDALALPMPFRDGQGVIQNFITFA